MSTRSVTRCLLLCLALSSGLSAAASIDVPFVRQQENGCGAAATAMVMQYWTQRGLAVSNEVPDAKAIYQSLYSNEANGIFGSSMARYLKEHGFRPYVFEGGWKDLAWHLQRGRPLIVCVRKSVSSIQDHAVGSSVPEDVTAGDVVGGHDGVGTRNSFLNNLGDLSNTNADLPSDVTEQERSPLHYLVIAGIDERLDAVVVNDSARHKLTRIDRKTFEQDWEAGNHWTLLALPEKSR